MRAVLIGLAVAAAGAESLPPIAALRFDGDRLLVAGGNTIRVAPAPQWIPRTTATSKLSQVFDVAVRGSALAVAGGTPAVTGAVELGSGFAARAGDSITAVTFAPDGARLAAASADHHIYIVRPDGERIARLAGHVGPVLCVAFSPDGSMLATGSADRSIRLWDGEGKLLRSLQNHASAVNSVVFSPDGQTLYSASEDATVRVWVAANGRMKHIYRGFDAPILAMAGALVRNRLVTAGADGGLRIVDAESGAIVKTIAGEAGAAWLHAVAVSADGKWIATGDAAGRLRVMEFPQ